MSFTVVFRRGLSVHVFKLVQKELTVLERWWLFLILLELGILGKQWESFTLNAL